MADKGATSPSKIWRIVLVISLALNLAIVGLVAGFSYRSGVGGKPPHRFDVGLGPIGQALTSEQRREIGQILRNNSDLRRDGNRRANGVMRQIAELVRSEPFDRASVEEALSADSSRVRLMQKTAIDALLEQIEEMSPQERQDFADRLTKMTPGRRN